MPVSSKPHMRVSLCVSGSDGTSTVNHDAASGIGCETPGRGIRVFPPLTMLYAASELRAAGCDVELRDFNTSETTADEWVASHDLREGTEAVVLLSSLTTLERDRGRVSRLRARYPELFIVTMGTFYEHFAASMLAAGADAVVYGTPELAIADCVLQKRRGAVRAEMTARALEDLQFPLWDALDMSLYTSHTVLSSRGCSFGCSYCPHPVYQADRVIARSPESTLAEIAWLHERYQPDYFLFRDPLFTFDAGRSRAIIGGIQAAAPGVQWACETRFELLPAPLIHLMRDSGVHHVRMGIETADPKVLSEAGRIGSTSAARRHLERARDTLATLKGCGIRSVCFFMFGFPSDTADVAESIMDFVRSADPDVALLNYTTPYVGTPLHDQMHSEGLVDLRDLTRYGSKMPVARTRALDAERVLELGAAVQKFFRSRNRQFYPIR